MAGPTLNIPEETMRGLIGDAILTAIDQEARDALIQSAINYLIAPTKHPDSWRNEIGPSPLESAFKTALEQYARGYVRTWMESSDEFATTIRAQLDDLFASYKTQLEAGPEFRTALNGWVIEYLTTNRRDSDRY